MARTMKPKTGRPTKCTPEVIAEICERMVDGKNGYPESLSSICRGASMPAMRTVLGWLQGAERDDADPLHVTFARMYACAREAQADAMDGIVLEIIRKCTPRTANADRVRIDALKWRAAHLKPRVYGNRTAIDHGIQPDNILAEIVREASGLPLLPSEQYSGES